MPEHPTYSCTSACKICGRIHHTLLTQRSHTKPRPPTQNESATALTAIPKNVHSVLLMTSRVVTEHRHAAQCRATLQGKQLENKIWNYTFNSIFVMVIQWKCTPVRKPLDTGVTIFFTSFFPPFFFFQFFFLHLFFPFSLLFHFPLVFYQAFPHHSGYINKWVWLWVWPKHCSTFFLGGGGGGGQPCLSIGC